MTLRELRDEMERGLTRGVTVGDVQGWVDAIDAMIEAQYKTMATMHAATQPPDRAERDGSTGHPARPQMPPPPDPPRGTPPVKVRIPGTDRRIWTEDVP